MVNKVRVGIDPGVKTGLCAVANGEIATLLSCAVPVAMEFVRTIRDLPALEGADILVLIEDARQRTWFGDSGPEVWQGAGSIKRECAIWESFCEYHRIPFKMVKPQVGGTKWTHKQFMMATGYRKGRTNSHQRDAALLVWGL